MRTFYLLSILLIPFTTLKSQNKLQYKNIDVGFGAFSVLLKNDIHENESGGLTFNVNNEFVINKNLISLNFISGGGVGSGYVSIGGDFSFYKVDALYGREFVVSKWLSFDANAGIGYYQQKGNLYFTDIEFRDSTINFPIKVSMIFLSNNRIGFGFNANYDINKLNNTFAGNLFLRINILKN